MRETEIIGQFFARDEAALTSVQSEYGAYCSTIARNILRDKEDVEECLNDTWLKAWNTTIPPKRLQSLFAYLGRVTRNGALNMVRDQNRRNELGINIPPRWMKLESYPARSRGRQSFVLPNKLVAKLQR
ncbi:RNA polymerase sigma factor [Lactobacillus delbrueckii]|uniref:RNA polymerase sigma factor n=1 Tax=Lactobacillus delbrueckii TaxID=1584 RepID=UPI000AFFADE0|nr:sigma factor [Lactobacillus delbrueckii]BBL28222.1 hypothetical protein LDE01_15190 [Lactobacillus delbrueckii subsp. delbrueckii]GEA75819.1 hypothetical protein LDE03_16270 [Lactobacillus delbrueckii subsp. delbrueckii]